MEQQREEEEVALERRQPQHRSTPYGMILSALGLNPHGFVLGFYPKRPRTIWREHTTYKHISFFTPRRCGIEHPVTRSVSLLAPAHKESVYFDNHRVDRRQPWHNVSQLSSVVSNPWIRMILGDFNTILHVNEAFGRDRRWSKAMEEFSAFLRETGLEDLRYCGIYRTWSNRSLVAANLSRKLGKDLINHAWINKFPQGLSDLPMVAIKPGEISPRKNVPFRFFNFWSNHSEFISIVTSAWAQEFQGTRAFKVVQKLRSLKQPLQLLNKMEFSRISERFLAANYELNACQHGLDLNPTDSQLRHKADLSLAEEQLFKQKEKIKWLEVGNQNTSYFFINFSCKPSRRKRVSLADQNEDPVHGGELKTVILNHFKSLLGQEHNGYLGTETISTIGFSGIQNATVECSPSELNSRDQSIGKILCTVINCQGKNLKAESSHEEEDAQLGESSHEEEEEENEESEEEVIELEFERAVEKLDTHTMHCPNCNSCITEVILRRKKHPEPVLGCLSCFTLFIPTGSGFNLFRIFGYGRKDKDTQISQQEPAATENLPASDIAYEKGNMVIEQGNVDRQHVNKNDQSAPAPSLEGTVSLGHQITNVEEEADGKTMKGTALPTKPESEIKEMKNGEDKKHEEQNNAGADVTILEAGLVTDPTKQKIGSEIKGSKTFDILKSIVYGGLMESIASLRVVSSAAAADATTLNIIALGLANLIGGLFIIGHNLVELNNERNVEAHRYKGLLGQRGNFLLHPTVDVLSFLVFGLIPPVTYGFSFRKSDDGDLKLVAVAAASLLCIAILAFGKAHIQSPPRFYMRFKTVLYYVTNAILVSGGSYAAGVLIKRLMEKLGWFECRCHSVYS